MLLDRRLTALLQRIIDIVDRQEYNLGASYDWLPAAYDFVVGELTSRDIRFMRESYDLHRTIHVSTVSDASWGLICDNYKSVSKSARPNSRMNESVEFDINFHKSCRYEECLIVMAGGRSVKEVGNFESLEKFMRIVFPKND